MVSHDNDYSPTEMLAIFFARQIEDGVIMTAGANTAICFAAVMVAQKLYAPSALITLGANCIYCNVWDRDCTLYNSSGDFRNFEWAESRYQHPDIFLYLPRAGHWFVGGFEIDKFGNTNLAGKGFDPEKGRWQFRGTGQVGIGDVSGLVKENYIFTMHHNKKSLVDKVEHIAHVGYLDGPGAREKLGLLGKGPRLLATPRAVFDFHPDTKRARLFGLMPGTSLDWVVENTGFEIVMPEKVITIDPPTEEEIEVLRSIDKLGICK